MIELPEGLYETLHFSVLADGDRVGRLSYIRPWGGPCCIFGHCTYAGIGDNGREAMTRAGLNVRVNDDFVGGFVERDGREPTWDEYVAGLEIVPAAGR